MSAMGDLLGKGLVWGGKDQLYSVLDRLLKHRDALCTHLQGQWRDLFGAQLDVLLYDLTSTYFEGQAEEIHKARYGYNALYLEVVRLAYNLVTAFQRMCLPEGWQSLTLSKLRHRLFWLPGELTRPQNRPTLRLPGPPAVQERTTHILQEIHKLKSLEGG